MRNGLTKQQVLRRLRHRRERTRAGAASDLTHWSWAAYNPLAGRSTAAGVYIQAETALAIPAYFACIRVVSEDIAKLPFRVARVQQPRGREVLRTSPVFRLLNRQPNPWMSAYTFRETMTQWALGWGNGYAEILRDNRGAPQELWPVHPARVTVKIDGGALYYEVRTDQRDQGGSHEIIRVSPRDILHVRGIGTDICGYSIANIGRESLGLSLAAQDFGASFFGNDATLGNYVIPPDGAGVDQRRQLQENLDRVKESQFKHLVLPPGVKVERGMVPPEDIQFLETRQFQVEEVCRWFRVPPHKIQHLLRSTFSNIEHQGIEYVVDTLSSWATRWEQEVAVKLIADPNVEARHIFNALLRGDYATRTAGYATLRQNGIYSANDVRELEDENPITTGGGDDYHIQKNMQRLEDVGQELQMTGGLLPQQTDPAADGEDESDEDEPPSPDDEARVRAVVADAAARCERRRIKATLTQAKAPERHFIAWLNKFLSGHRAYMASQLSSIWEFLGRPDGFARMLDECHAHYLRSTMIAYRKNLLAELPADEQNCVEALTEVFLGLGGRNGHRSLCT